MQGGITEIGERTDELRALDISVSELQDRWI